MPDAPRRPDLEDAVFALKSSRSDAFRRLCVEVRSYQRRHNPVVSAFGDAARYLPTDSFSLADVCTVPMEQCQRVFLSSGTGSGRSSRHGVPYVSVYERSIVQGFRYAFGDSSSPVVGYAPEYGSQSSLVYMLRHLAGTQGIDSVVVTSATELRQTLHHAAERSLPVMAIGAAFGLLDALDDGPMPLCPGSTVIETGGMKTHRREVARAELHDRLAQGFGVAREHVGSEYGMCELLSQGWARGGAWYELPPWCSFEILDPEDPARAVSDGVAGRLAIIDLANLYSASFLLTSDRAVARGERFTILGRLDTSDLRGCNFLFEDPVPESNLPPA